MPEQIDVLLLSHPETDVRAVHSHLEGAGYTPAIAEAHGRADLDQALADKFDIVLGDPELDGLSPREVLSKLRGAPGAPPFIAFAPGLTHDSGTEAVRAGAFDYFAEEDMGRLPATVHRAFRDWHTRREWGAAMERSGRFEALQRELFKNSPEAIAILDERERVVEVNPAFEQLFGYANDEAAGTPIRDLIVPEDKFDEYVSIAARVYQGKVTRMESTRRHKDGRGIRVSAVGIPVQLAPETMGVYAVYSDITARMRAIEALRQAESNYRNFFMNAVEGMYVSSPLGRFVLANPALAELLGYDAPADVTDSVRSISREIYAEPDHRDRFLAAISEDDTARLFRARARRKDGTEVDVIENVRAVRDDDGELLYYQGTMVRDSLR